MNEDITHGQKLSSAALISCVNKCANTRFVRTILCWDCFYFFKLLGKCEGLLNNTPAHATEIPQVKNDYRDSVQRFHAECWCTLELPVNDKIVRNPQDLSTQQMVFLQLWCDGHSFLLIQAYVGTSDKNIGFLLQCYLLPILLVIPSSWVPACWSYFLLESMWLRQGVFLSPILISTLQPISWRWGASSHDLWMN